MADSTKDAAEAAKKTAQEAHKLADKAAHPVMPTPSSGDGKDKRMDKGDWALL